MATKKATKNVAPATSLELCQQVADTDNNDVMFAGQKFTAHEVNIEVEGQRPRNYTELRGPITEAADQLRFYPIIRLHQANATIHLAHQFGTTIQGEFTWKGPESGWYVANYKAAGTSDNLKIPMAEVFESYFQQDLEDYIQEMVEVILAKSESQKQNKYGIKYNEFLLPLTDGWNLVVQKFINKATITMAKRTPLTGAQLRAAERNGKDTYHEETVFLNAPAYPIKEVTEYLPDYSDLAEGKTPVLGINLEAVYARVPMLNGSLRDVRFRELLKGETELSPEAEQFVLRFAAGTVAPALSAKLGRTIHPQDVVVDPISYDVADDNDSI